MSAAEHQSSNSSQSAEKSLKKPPQRPTLLEPPHRSSDPMPEAKAQTPVSAQPKPAADASPQEAPPPEAPPPEEDAPKPITLHPISPPSEPMQYRAIGLVRGIYQPDPEQLNHGSLTTEDGTVIDSVLLGRVTSLIKKHIDLEKSHLWVVYPRTRQEEKEGEAETTVDLHLQIVGVWEPETLGLPGENPGSPDDEDPSSTQGTEDTDSVAHETVGQPVVAPPLELSSENYFSIRGEILKCDEEANQILVKILQGAKRSQKTSKAFRLHVSGQITGKTTGYFWELDVERQGKALVLVEGQPIGIVPPKKRKKGIGGKNRRPLKGGPRPRSKAPTPQSKEKPRIRPSAPVKSNPL